jgi:hypothetical protein
MANAVEVTTEDGKTLVIAGHNIATIEHVPGEPGESAVEAQDEVKDDPGEEPSATNPVGRPPKKGHPKIEAKPGKDAVPDTAIIKLMSGDSVTVQQSAKHLRDMMA